MTIRVVRRRGVDAAPPRVLRMRGIASPITGISGCSSSRGPVGSPVPGMTAGSMVGLGVGSMVGVGIGGGAGV